MKKGKSKPIKVEYQSEFKTNIQGKEITLYGFNVEFQDGTKGLYNTTKKDSPKFVVGQEAEYTADEREKNGRKYTIVKYVSQNNYGKWQPKPNNVIALEMSRRMYNSSQQTADKWDFDQLLKMATYLHNQLKSGVDKEAIECSVTIQCAMAMNGNAISTKEMAEQIKQAGKWLQENS